MRFLLLLIALSATACSKSGPSLPSVERKSVEYMSALAAGDFARIDSFYVPQFYKTTPKEGWQQELREIAVRLGARTSFKLRNKRKDTRFSGIFYFFQYDVEYEKGYAKELVTFFIPVEDDEQIGVVAHKIDPRPNP